MTTTALSWPTHLDYRDAMAAPALALVDPQLAQGTVRKTTMGLPRAATGGFASVYKVSNGQHSWAVRCFTNPVDPTLHRRYTEIGRALRTAGLPYTVEFDYQDRGIRVDGKPYPIVKMLWVDAQPLNTYVETLIGKRSVSELEALARAWKNLSERLSAAGLAHGDLQHGNVLVSPAGRLFLVDYDGFFVPALAGMPATENGQPAYQHPKRGRSDFGPHLDRYAALTVYVALLALAKQPALWGRYDNEDNLLFVKEDHGDPASSALFSELLRLDKSVAVPASHLADAALTKTPATTPLIAQVLASGVVVPVQGSTHSVGGASRGSSWFRDAAAAESGAARLADHVQVSWSPALKPVWSRPGTRVVRWQETEPVYKTEDYTEEVVSGFWFWKTTDVVHRRRQVQSGTRQVPKTRVDQIGRRQHGLLAVGYAAGRPVAVHAAGASWWNDSAAENPDGSFLQGDTLLAVIGGEKLIVANGYSFAVRNVRGGGVRRIQRPSTDTSRYRALACHASGAYAVSRGKARTVDVYDASGVKTAELKLTRRMVTQMVFTAPDRLLLSSADALTLADTRTRRAVATGRWHVDEVTAIAASADGALLASADEAGDVFVYDGNLARRASFHLDGAVTALAIAPDSRHVLVAYAGSSEIVVLDSASRHVAGRVSGHHGPIVSVAIDAQGRVITGDSSGLLVQWSNDSGSAAVNLSQVHGSRGNGAGGFQAATRTVPPARRASSGQNQAAIGPRGGISTAVNGRGPGPCPRCGTTCIEKQGNRGIVWWACPRFPACKGARV